MKTKRQKALERRGYEVTTVLRTEKIVIRKNGRFIGSFCSVSAAHKYCFGY